MTILLSPGDPGQLTGGYRYNARIVAQWHAQGDPIEVISLPGDWPLPAPDDVADCLEILHGLPSGEPILIDGLALAGVADGLDSLCMRAPVSLLLHSPPHTERGTPPHEAARLYAMAARAVRQVRRVIATSPAAAEEVRRLFPVTAVAAVTPGCDRMPTSTGAGSGRLLSVATVTPRKGHLTLIAALRQLQHLPWSLSIVGSLTRAPAHVAAVRRAIAEGGLTERIALLGERDGARLADLYGSADVFVLPTWHETFGMVLTEAMSAHLPIISTTAGAVPQTVPDGAGLLVPPGDPAALARAIASVRTDPALRASLSAAAAAHPVRDWADAAAELAALLEEDDG